VYLALERGRNEDFKVFETQHIMNENISVTYNSHWYSILLQNISIYASLRNSKADNLAQVVGCLPNQYNALSSKPQ
jgi:hypothetical protein